MRTAAIYLAISLVAVSCRSVERATEVEQRLHTTDSVVVAKGWAEGVALNTESTVEVDEWYFYPDTAQADEPKGVKLYRRVRVESKKDAQARRSDSVAVAGRSETIVKRAEHAAEKTGDDSGDKWMWKMLAVLGMVAATAQAIIIIKNK